MTSIGSIFCIVFTLILQGCGPGQRSHLQGLDTDATSGSRASSHPSFYGRWSSDCLPGSDSSELGPIFFKQTIDISESGFVISLDEYALEGCKNQISQIRSVFNLELRARKGETAYDLDLALKWIDQTFFDDVAASNATKDRMFLIDHWKVGVTYQIPNTGGDNFYDIIEIRGDELCEGKKTERLNGSSQARRPIKIKSRRCLKKV